MTLPAPAQQFFSIGDVCALTELKPHVLRYWESQFRFLSPAKNRSGNRVYKGREVELIMLVKHLLYTEKFTIEGARQRLDQYRRSGELKGAAKDAMRFETVHDLRRSLDNVLAVLAGKPVMQHPVPVDADRVAAPDSAVVTAPAPAMTEPPTPRQGTANPLTAHGDEQLALG